jgi:hypothetical protein
MRLIGLVLRDVRVTQRRHRGEGIWMLLAEQLAIDLDGRTQQRLGI